MNNLRKLGVMTTINAVLTLIIGILFCIRPFVAEGVLTIVIGTVLIINGMIDVYDYLTNRNMLFLFRRGGLILGVLKIALGILILVEPEIPISLLAGIFSFYILIMAAAHIENAILIAKLGIDGWLLLFGTALLLIIGAVYLLLSPALDPMTVYIWIGVSLIIDSIISLITVFRLKQMDHDLYCAIRNCVEDFRGTVIDMEEIEIR